MNVLLSVTLCCLIAVSIGFTVPDHSENQSNSATSLQRIQGGSYTTILDYPFLVALYIHPTNAFCGGSIISDTRILTAAHCYEGVTGVNNRTSIVFGSTYRDVYYPNETYQVIQDAIGHLVHPDYASSMFSVTADIAIIFYSGVNFSPGISSIALPSDASDSYVNAAVKLAGWGLTAPNSGISHQLKYVGTTILSNANCVLAAFPVSVNSAQMCTSGYVSSTSLGGCYGDSGGPVFTSDTVSTLIGIISARFTLNSCSGSRATVSTRITSYLSWINANS